LENNKAVALPQQRQPGLMFLQKTQELWRRPVIGKLRRFKLLVMQHPIEKLSPDPTSLAALVHIKVQHTHWRRLPEDPFVLHTRGMHAEHGLQAMPEAAQSQAAADIDTERKELV
jgi:hypothetical protein